MAPKNDAPVAETSDLITNFSAKECKLLAAAFISSVGPDKYDYELMATLTGNTAGSLKKMWPPVKKKAVENYASFGTFLGQVNGEAKVATPSKATPGKKRKAADEGLGDAAGDDKTASPVKGRGRPKKQVKKEEPVSEDNASVDNAKDSTDGGNGQGQETTDEA